MPAAQLQFHYRSSYQLQRPLSLVFFFVILVLLPLRRFFFIFCHPFIRQRMPVLHTFWMEEFPTATAKVGGIRPFPLHRTHATGTSRTFTMSTGPSMMVSPRLTENRSRMAAAAATAHRPCPTCRLHGDRHPSWGGAHYSARLRRRFGLRRCLLASSH